MLRPGVSHLHELPEGSRFRFDGDTAEFRLIEITPASCRIAEPPKLRHKVIKPRFSEIREFDVVETGVRRCAPGAMVVAL